MKTLPTEQVINLITTNRYARQKAMKKSAEMSFTETAFSTWDQFLDNREFGTYFEDKVTEDVFYMCEMPSFPRHEIIICQDEFGLSTWQKNEGCSYNRLRYREKLEQALELVEAVGYEIRKDPPKVLVIVKGGIVQEVITSSPMRCFVLDKDPEIEDDEDIAPGLHATEWDTTSQTYPNIYDYFAPVPGDSVHEAREKEAIRNYFKTDGF